MPKAKKQPASAAGAATSNTSRRPSKFAQQVASARHGQKKGRQDVEAATAGPHTVSSSQASRAPAKAHGKDARLVQVVKGIDQQSSSSGAPTTATPLPFDPRSAGKRSVYRPILMSPYRIDWPSIGPTVSSALFHTFLDLVKLERIQKGFFQRVNKEMPRESARKTKEKRERRKARLLMGVLRNRGLLVHRNKASSDDKATQESQGAKDVSPFLCGLNGITRILEEAVRRHLGGSATPAADTDRLPDPKPSYTPRVIFVCQDVDPAALTAHLPTLVATYNASALLQKDKKDSHRHLAHLIRIPMGSEEALADALGLRRCSAISLDTEMLRDYCAQLEGDADRQTLARAVNDLLDKMQQSHVEPLRFAWLESALKGTLSDPSQTAPFLEPRIKHIHTSAPLDMNAIKQERRGKRAERKKRKKEAAKAVTEKRKALLSSLSNCKRRNAVRKTLGKR